MSEPSRMRAYRACVNLPNISNGQQILIDEDEPRWADWIGAGFIVPVGPPVGYEPPAEPITRDNAGFASSNEDEKSVFPQVATFPSEVWPKLEQPGPEVTE